MGPFRKRPRSIHTTVAGEMKVSAEVLTGGFFYIEVASGAKVRDLKRRIELQMKVPYNRLILLLDTQRSRGARLIEETKDERFLAEVGVRDGAHIYLFFKPLNHPDNGGGTSCGGSSSAQ